MAQTIDLHAPSRKVHAGVILVGGETEVLDIAPIDLLNSLTEKWNSMVPPGFVSDAAKKEIMDVEFHWVNESGEPANLTSGMRLLPTDTFATCPPLDIALMGAHNAGYKLSEGEIAFIRKTYDECSHFMTICGGFLAPLEAGILAGKTCTAPRQMIEQLRKEVPVVNWTEKRWECDGKLWTSGALLNGTDMIRAWAEQTISNGKGSLVNEWMAAGSWPNRDREYKDEVKSTSVGVAA